MTPAVNQSPTPIRRYRINGCQRIMLVFLPVFLLVMLGVNIWTSAHLRNLSKWETVAFPMAIIVLAAFSMVHFFNWFNFKVELSDRGIDVHGKQMHWEDLKSVQAKLPSHFSSFSALIELKTRDGNSCKIPACIQRSSDLMREIRAHMTKTEISAGEL
jgi:hypothetical protein